MMLRLHLRRRGALSEAIPELNARLVEELRQVTGFWNPEKPAKDAPLGMSGDLNGGGLDLRKVLVEGLVGQTVYLPRLPYLMEEDNAQGDDLLVIHIDPGKADYARFCRDIIPRLVTIWGAYRGSVETDQAVCLSDGALRREQANHTDRDIDGRDSVLRIWPVSFVDDLLYQRSFGIDAAEVVCRAAPACEHAELIAGGAFLIVTSDILSGADALNALNARIMSLIGMDPPVSSPTGGQAMPPVGPPT